MAGKDFIAFIHTLMVETRSKLERQHKSGSAELSQNKAVHESTAYQFHSNHGILTLSLSPTELI